MARRDSSANGCLLIFGVLFAPCIGGFALGVPAFVLAAPAVAPYLYFKDRAQFEPHRLEWVVAAAAAPLLALALVWWASPANGRLRGRRQVDADPQRARSRSRTRRPSVLLAYLVRAAILLSATAASALVMLLRGNDAHGPDAMEETLTVFGGAALAAVVVLVAIRLWDRHPYVEPVTVETVREAAEQADRTLRRVRADNQRLTRLVREVDAKLAAARTGTDFVGLRNLHFESVGCADGAYGHYQSAQTSLRTMARILGRVKAASRRPLGVVGRPVTQKARRNGAELNAAASSLADTHGQLDVEVQRGLGLVRTLNANTAELKYSIRDGCGEPGKRWYEALERRIEAARINERRSARTAR